MYQLIKKETNKQNKNKQKKTQLGGVILKLIQIQLLDVLSYFSILQYFTARIKMEVKSVQHSSSEHCFLCIIMF